MAKKTVNLDAKAERLRKDAIASIGRNLAASAPTPHNVATTGQRAAKSGPKATPRKKSAHGGNVAAKGQRAQDHRVPSAKEVANNAANDAYAKRAKGTKAKPATKSKRLSGLDAAAQVLAASKKPMGAIELVDAMRAKGLWTTKGKTPHATIYAAIIREIAAKGNAARFKKVGRGQFAAGKGA